MARTANTFTQVTDHVKHATDRWLSSQLILDLCRQLGHRFRRGTLDPVHTIHLFLMQILHGNTAITTFVISRRVASPPRPIVRRGSVCRWSCSGGSFAPSPTRCSTRFRTVHLKVASGGGGG